MIKIKSLVKYSIISVFGFVLLLIMDAVKDSPYKTGSKTVSADVVGSSCTIGSCATNCADGAASCGADGT